MSSRSRLAASQSYVHRFRYPWKSDGRFGSIQSSDAFFPPYTELQAKDYLVNDVLIGSCDPLSSKPFRRPEMSAFNSSTTMDETIGRLHGCPTRSIDALVSNLPEHHRGNLAVFCYGRAHLHEASLAIAATCNLDALVDAGGKPGAFLFEQSRRPPETDHTFSRANNHFLRCACSERSPEPNAGISIMRTITRAI